MPSMTTTAPQLILHDFPADTGLPGWDSFSPFVLEIHRALRLAKLPYETQKVDLIRGFKRVNPLGQLPVLTIGAGHVRDSTCILHRIEALAQGTLNADLDARTRAESWLWEEFSDTALYPYVLATRWADDRGWPVPRKAFFGGMPAPLRWLVPAMVRKQTIKKLIGRDFLRAGLPDCYERMARVLDALDARAPEAGFWLGARPSVADLGLFAQLHSLRLPLVEFAADEVKKRARLSRYLDRVDAATRAGV